MEYVKADTMPASTPYLTAGKIYEFWRSEVEPFSGGVIDADDGATNYILLSGCAHLEGGDWTLCDKFGAPTNKESAH